jgi:hypothetical protein
VSPDPEVVEAIPAMIVKGLIAPEPAARAHRVARGELVSVRAELRLLLYVGVTLATAGVGVLVQQNIEHIGPLAIAVAIGVAAAACLAWSWRVAPPFSWAQQESPNLAFDYILLLGALLVGADLAYIEVKLTPFGAAWPWHLLIVAAIYLFLALRFDSRVVFSLALSTFAAWRGVTPSSLTSWSWHQSSLGVIRLNAIACGVLFVVAGTLLARTKRKAHFEPVAAHLGWLLILGALVQGALSSSYREPRWPLYATACIVVAAVLACFARRAGRFPLFGLGVAAAYLAMSRIMIEALDDEKPIVLWFCLSAIAVVVLLFRAHRSKRETP